MRVYENFIAYRRIEASKEAKILYEKLQQKGFETMLDTEELTSGSYKEHLYEFASTCTNYIVLLTENSFDRCQQDTDDLFAKGIEYAINSNKNVIPIFVANEIAFPSNMPSNIEKLSDYESCLLKKDTIDDCIDDIIKRFLVDKRKLSVSDSDRDFFIEGDTLVEFLGRASIVRIPDEIRVIGKEAFKDKTKITKIVFNDGLELIEDGAFERCINISNVIIPSSVKKIGKKSFSRCYNLAYVDLGSGLTEISEEAFSYCAKLKWFQVTSGVEKLHGSAFNGCSNLEAFRVDCNNEHFKEIDGILYDLQETMVIRCPENNELDYIDIPNSIKIIGPWAFYRCLNISQITISLSVNEICEYAFGECSNITSIVLSANVKKFNISAVEGWKPNRIRFSRDFSPVEKKKIEAKLKSKSIHEKKDYGCKFVIIKTTFESVEEAKNMANMLVKGKYIVSGQIHKIESIYLWESEVNDEFEYELSCITTAENAENAKRFITANHSYETCQLLITPVVDVTDANAEWIYNSLEE